FVVAVAIGLCTATTASADTIYGPPLPAPHVGVPVIAPPPPLVNGMPPTLVMHLWQRCDRYSVLVNADGATGVWHLDDDVADGAITGTISGAKRFYGNNSLTVSTSPDVAGTKPYTLELWARPSNYSDSRYH